ncbi:MAG TPA: hypothetical protein VI731_04900 [Bacteroidia bacterium]|nr:hypothetical protein [Bacteroidia bacterium]
MALAFFREAYKVDSANSNINYKMGVCYLNSFSERAKALPYLRKASKGISRNYDPYDPKLKKAPENTYYFLAQAYHYNYSFDSAIMYLESWKALIGKRDELANKDIDMRINWAKNAKEFVSSPVPVTITNLGDSVNGPTADYSPVISLDENFMIFTSRRTGELGIDGQHYEEIFICDKLPDGTWSAARPISPYINTLTNEASISISADGNTLFIYKDDGGGNIYSSSVQDGQWITPAPVGSDVNTQYWETHACLSADGSTLYFVSDRPGGFGGRDIYRCVRIGDFWSKAQNLGPVINTEYDEESPFLHPDQRTMFFSSKGHKSMGGFDIFFTAKNDTGVWVEPVNIGYPINTPDDDIFYNTSPDGKRAYFSSVREGGRGEKDIYMATLLKPTTQALTLLTGRMYNADGKPLTQKIDIVVTNSTTGDQAGIYKPNRNGKFSIILVPGSSYQISYYVDDKERTSELIEVPETGFSQINRTIDLKDLVLGRLPGDFTRDSALAATILKSDSLSRASKKPKDWKDALTETENLNFTMFFKFNISEVDPSDKDFKLFIDSCVAHVNKSGEINFRITAAASKVPTKKFKSNSDLATDRANKARDKVNAALKAKGIDLTKVHWTNVQSYVLGPPYNASLKKNAAVYEKYQYVKIHGY